MPDPSAFNLFITQPKKQSMKHQKLAFVSASALTAGLAHSQVVTNSQIVYSYADITVPTTTAGYTIDLNHDGYPDFQAHFDNNNSSKPYLDTSSYLGQPNFTPSVLAGAGDGLPVATNGTPIGSGYESPEEYGYFYQDTGANVQGAWDSAGTNVQGYVGLTLQDGSGHFYYGWAQFVYNSATVFDGTAGELTLIDYAFDQNQDETIPAGENAPPGSAPQIVVPPVSQTNGVMTSVQFTVVGTGNPYPTYQWLAETNGSSTFTPLTDGGPISGSQSNVLTISNLVPGFSGKYIAELQNTNGSTVTPVPATLMVAPLTINGPTPSSLQVFPGATASLAVSVISTPPILSYQWLKNGSILNSGGEISGTTTSNLVIMALGTNDAANYSVVVSNMFGAVTSVVDAVSITLPNSPYEQQVSWTYPISYYAFNDTNDPASGTAPAFDYIAGANGLYGNATENGNAKYNIAGPNPPGGFLGFATTNSAVAIINNVQQTASAVSLPPLNLNANTVTFTMWIYPTQTEAGWAVLNSYRSSVSGTANGMNYTSGGTTLGYHWNDDGNTYNWNSGLTPPTGQWSFIALVISPTEAVEYMFNANGMAAATNNYAHVVQPINTPGFIGSDLHDANFIGSIDEVATFKQSLTETQLTNLWTAAVTGVVTPPSATVSIAPSGANLIISWNPPLGMLLQAPSPNGPWTTNNAASSPYTTTPNSTAMFYRVIAP
jgi:hypothetical protein